MSGENYFAGKKYLWINKTCVQKNERKSFLFGEICSVQCDFFEGII